MYFGADYYPEHWDPSRWNKDAGLMKKAGFNVTRLAEFAWVMLEPSDGCYTFDWLDEAIATLGRHGVDVILCTPTAIVPAWVVRKYPEVMAQQNAGGARGEWGVRKDQCYSSGAFRMLSQRITREMAMRYRETPNVIGWQTDNEFNGPVCWCDTCREEFRDFLQRRYETVDDFNRAMGRHFWGHAVGSWQEIELPVQDIAFNPSLGLEWKRFLSWLNVRFQREQVAVLRELCPRHFITHNLMGIWPPQVDYFDLAEDLDHVSWDHYPISGPPMLQAMFSATADFTRSCKKKNFWIMETTAGPHGWGTYGRNLRPGEMRTLAFHHFAHGCDHQIWFRWRTCTAGREQYWHGLLGHDGRPLRRYREAAAIAGELRGLESELANTTVKPRVAIVFDYDSRWATDLQPGYSENDYVRDIMRYYDALHRAGIGVDMVRPSETLDRYRLVIAPNLYVLPDATAERLCAYVRSGGVLLCDQRTAVKDDTGLCHERTLPGLLGAVLGIEIPEYESITEEPGYAIAASELGGAYTAVGGADWIVAQSADVLATYEHWHMKPFAALTRNRAGKGVAWYCGTVIKEPAFYDALIARLLKDARIRSVCRPPEGVDVSVREGAGKKLLFLVNFSETPATVRVPEGKQELLTGKQTGREWDLDRFGVAVIKLK